MTCEFIVSDCVERQNRIKREERAHERAQLLFRKCERVEREDVFKRSILTLGDVDWRHVQAFAFAMSPF